MDERLNPMDHMALLMARYQRLDDFYKGYLDGHIDKVLEAFATGLSLVEKMQADKRAKQRPMPVTTHLRIVGTRSAKKPGKAG